MNLDLLRSFFAISEFGSLSKAAEQLHVSQSTLTRQVQALETEIGGQLLERGHRGVDDPVPEALARQFEWRLQQGRQVGRFHGAPEEKYRLVSSA